MSFLIGFVSGAVVGVTVLVTWSLCRAAALDAAEEEQQRNAMLLSWYLTREDVADDARLMDVMLSQSQAANHAE